MKTDKIFNDNYCQKINVSESTNTAPERSGYIREFNRGKSFDFSV